MDLQEKLESIIGNDKQSAMVKRFLDHETIKPLVTQLASNLMREWETNSGTGGGIRILIESIDDKLLAEFTSNIADRMQARMLLGTALKVIPEILAKEASR